MRPAYVTDENLNHFIAESLKEDVGSGDYSTLSTIPEEAIQQAKLIVKEDCILAGVELAQYIFNFLDSNCKIEIFLHDGVEAKKGDVAFLVTAKTRILLTAERLILNCMQRMSGIATLTQFYVNKIKDSHTQLLDTRKTSPNFRMCEKWAVVIGGGTNHRFGLYDMIMLKDNHIDYAGGIIPAVTSTKKYLKENNLDLKIEVETRNLKEVKEALSVGGVNRIMLDNMDLDTMEEAVKIINKRAETEASGGITAESLLKIVKTGVDFVSCGAITHSAKNIDLSLKAVK